MPKILHTLILCCLALVVFPLKGHTIQITGRVVKVHSGDTIEILVDQTPMRVHLYGIDCPVEEQAFSNEAIKYTTLLAHGKVVTVDITNSDRRGGKIGTVMLPGEKNLNCELVKAGLAWWNRQIAPDDRILKALEESARTNGNGLWSEPDPVPPWDFSKSPGERPRSITRQNRPSPSADDDTTVYITSTGEKYHRHGCRYLVKSMIPMKLGDTRTSGFVPCPVCDPPQ